MGGGKQGEISLFMQYKRQGKTKGEKLRGVRNNDKRETKDDMQYAKQKQKR